MHAHIAQQAGIPHDAARMRRRQYWLFGVCLICSCATTQPPGPGFAPASTPLLVLQPVTVMREAEAVDLAGLVVEQLRASGLHETRLFEEGGVGDAACGDDLVCVRDAGRRAGASKVVTLKVARLGDIVMVRVQLVDAVEGTQRTWQEAVKHPTDETLSAALTDIAKQVAETVVVPQQPPPWYRRWWIWTAGAAVLIGVASSVALAVVASDDRREPDVIVRPF